jgi:hypothetical protein
MGEGNYSERAFPQPVTKRRVDRDGPEGDFYPTPEWATFALTEVETFVGDIWEPACGNGQMSDILALATGIPVRSTDLFDRGYGDTGVDFLATEDRAVNIITNPPYHIAEKFILKAIEQADFKVAMLMRHVFCEGQGRYERLYSTLQPTRIWCFSERITFYADGKQTGGSGTTAYAWFVWEKGKRRADGFSDHGWIKPGAKDRYQLWIDNQ